MGGFKCFQSLKPELKSENEDDCSTMIVLKEEKDKTKNENFPIGYKVTIVFAHFTICKPTLPSKCLSPSDTENLKVDSQLFEGHFQPADIENYLSSMDSQAIVLDH